MINEQKCSAAGLINCVDPERKLILMAGPGCGKQYQNIFLSFLVHILSFPYHHQARVNLYKCLRK